MKKLKKILSSLLCSNNVKNNWKELIKERML